MLDKWHVYFMDEFLYTLILLSSFYSFYTNLETVCGGMLSCNYHVGLFWMLWTCCVGFSKGLEQLVKLDLNKKLRFLS